MVAVYQTAYPRLKSEISAEALEEIYTPTPAEKRFVSRHCRSKTASHLGMLIQLKLVQRLGRFPSYAEIPAIIIQHIKQLTRSKITKNQLKNYFSSGSRDPHIKLIRRYLGLSPYQANHTSVQVKQWALDAADTKESVADIINVTIERLVKANIELPGFHELERIGESARTTVNHRYYQQLTQHLDNKSLAVLEELLRPPRQSNNRGWNALKTESKKPTPGNIRNYLAHLEWLSALYTILIPQLALPPTKYQQFVDEAMALDYSQLMKLKTAKRRALVIILIRHQYARTLDHTADIFVKTLQKIDNTAQRHLDEYLAKHRKQTDHLVEVLSETVKAYLDPGQGPEALDHILGKEGESLLSMCNEYLAYADKNYLPFMLPLFKNQRTALFRTIELVHLESATEDQDLLKAFKFIQENKQKRSEWISIEDGKQPGKNRLNIRWIREKWWKAVTGKTTKAARATQVHKAYFELCVFERIAEELSTADLFIPNSDKFSDSRQHFIPWEDYEKSLPSYCEEVELPSDAATFTRALKTRLTEACDQADRQFPKDDTVRIDRGQLIIGRHKTEETSPEIKKLGHVLKERLEKISLLDMIVDSENWLNLSRGFGPLSGHQSRLDDVNTRFILTVFCYGTNIGPTETARSVKGLSRKQASWLNLKRVTEKRLDKAIVQVANAYKKFALIQHWGTGKSVSADGKLWDLYEDNLLSEYHIRYGSYGGIAYYHVSDTYIALFSHFIPCGVYEAIYILDGLLNDESDFNPDTVHGDTQAQSTPVFGLAYLLGIKLMPRIRNIKDLKFYKPDRSMVLQHIQSLFSDPLNWALIEKYYADMMRIAMSVKAGKMTASTILRRFGTKNRKNKLYFAFRELGRVVRTLFLLEYITDSDLRKTIHAATCKSEEFNEFARWLFFANGGKIPANLRSQQGKIVKYNHLLANIAILYNVNAMTQVFNELKAEGYPITKGIMAGFSPYHTEHLGRLGSFELDLGRKVKPLGYELEV